MIDSLTASLKRDNHISYAFLFGSFKDYDDRVGFRDIDIAVFITGAGDVLDYALGITAELSGKYNLPIDCIPLNIAPVFLRYRVFRDGEILFYRNEELMTDLMEKTANNALDYMPLREEAMRDLV